MDFKFPIFLYFLLLFPTNSLSCISVVKKTKADAVNAIANTLTNAAGIVLSSIPKVNNLFSPRGSLGVSLSLRAKNLFILGTGWTTRKMYC